MKLLLAEDTKDLNRAITAILTHQGYEVDSVFDGEEALEKIAVSAYDGILLDIMMPKKDGLEVLAEIRRRHILTPVMMLTAKAEIDDRVAGLDAGADDYLPKPFAMKELLARVRSLTRRGSEYDAKELRYCDVVLDSDELSLASCNTVRLSIKEFELMHALLAHADIEMSTQTLIERIWKKDGGASADTVWLYISYLKGKLSSIGSSVTITGERGGSFKLGQC
ncbi:MAG: response regulator transcription factor [Clostridia bacterium]|nr:response regulator transcription factor [Clostridia bacterium]